MVKLNKSIRSDGIREGKFISDTYLKSYSGCTFSENYLAISQEFGTSSPMKYSGRMDRARVVAIKNNRDETYDLHYWYHVSAGQWEDRGTLDKHVSEKDIASSLKKIGDELVIKLSY